MGVFTRVKLSVKNPEKIWVKPLEWYANLYSNGLNEGCDICWFLYGAAMHCLYGWLGPVFSTFLLIMVIGIKKVFPTTYDQGLVEQSDLETEHESP